jgi:hypothetical protein
VGSEDRHKQRELWASTPRGHLLLQTSFLQNSLYIAMEARGPTIDVFNIGGCHCWTCRQQPQGAAVDVFNIGGGRCRKSRQQPPGGSPSTSPASVVATPGPVANTPRGACHRRLQLRWWSLLDLPPVSSRGPLSTSSTSVVAAVGNPDSNP